jgi:hypothetical protein
MNILNEFQGIKLIIHSQRIKNKINILSTIYDELKLQMLKFELIRIKCMVKFQKIKFDHLRGRYYPIILFSINVLFHSG